MVFEVPLVLTFPESAVRGLARSPSPQLPCHGSGLWTLRAMALATPLPLLMLARSILLGLLPGLSMTSPGRSAGVPIPVGRRAGARQAAPWKRESPEAQQGWDVQVQKEGVQRPWEVGEKSPPCSLPSPPHTEANSGPRETGPGSCNSRARLLMGGADRGGECNDIIVCLI